MLILSLQRENLIFKKLNESFKEYIFENIYFPAAEKSENENFNIQVDIRLKNWIDNVLPASTVDVGLKVLSEQFLSILNKPQDHASHVKNCSENDFALFKNLKTAVAEDALSQHKWDSKAYDVLVSTSKLIRVILNR